MSTNPRQQLTEALMQLWADDAGETVEALRTDSAALDEALTPYLDALLPVVKQIAAQCTANALRTAAEAMRKQGAGPEVFVCDDMADALDPPPCGAYSNGTDGWCCAATGEHDEHRNAAGDVRWGGHPTVPIFAEMTIGNGTVADEKEPSRVTGTAPALPSPNPS